MSNFFNPYRMLPDTSRTIAYETEVFSNASTNALAPWFGVPVLSGSALGATLSPNHIGVISLVNGATVNSGYGYNIGTAGTIYFVGNEETTYVFKPVNTLNTTVRIGFQDTVTSNDAVDGAYFEATGLSIIGKTSNSNTRSTTTTNGVLVEDTWYTARVSINSNATLATFELSTAGSIVWKDTLSTNLPITPIRLFGSGIIAVSSGSSSMALYDWDYANVIINRTFNR